MHRQLRRDTNFPLIFVRYNPKDYAFLCTDKLPWYEQFFFAFRNALFGRLIKTKDRKNRRAQEKLPRSRGVSEFTLTEPVLPSDSWNGDGGSGGRSSGKDEKKRRRLLLLPAFVRNGRLVIRRVCVCVVCVCIFLRIITCTLPRGTDTYHYNKTDK